MVAHLSSQEGKIGPNYFLRPKSFGQMMICLLLFYSVLPQIRSVDLSRHVPSSPSMSWSVIIISNIVTTQY